jgi:hypothetical protein
MREKETESMGCGLSLAGYCTAVRIEPNQILMIYLYIINDPLSVLRIRDVYPGSRILILPIPDLGSKNSNKREE